MEIICRSSPPPSPSLSLDGGLQTWVHILCMYFVFFNRWGTLNVDQVMTEKGMLTILVYSGSYLQMEL